MAETVPTGKVHGVSERVRSAGLKGAVGNGDVVLDLRGARHLPAREQAVISARPSGSGRADVEKVTDNIGALPPWWFNPSNPQATTLPASVPISRYQKIMKALHRMDPKIGLTWHGVRNIWQLWYYKPGFTSYGNGWIMVKEFEPFRDTAYIMKVVNHMDSLRRGSASKRHKESKEAAAAHKQKVRKDLFQHDQDVAAEVYDFAKIKNYGKGNKFVTYG